MEIVIKKKGVRHDRLGRLEVDQKVDLPEAQARFFVERGDADLYLTKVLRDRPCVAGGEGGQSSALPAAQALPQATLIESADGGKKRGRRKKEA